MGSHHLNLANQQKHEERLALLGQMTAGVVHDVRNMLCTLGLNLERVEMLMELGSERAGDGLGQAQTVLKNLDSLLASVVDFSRNRDDHAAFEVNSWVEDTLKMLRPTVKAAGVQVTTSADDTYLLEGASNELRQVLCNLVLNACEALRGRSDAEVRIHLSAALDTLVISVEDNGPGVAPEEREKIFDSFHTTKPEGTGLGLWNCRRILAEHGGELELEEASGGGACFLVYLPLPARAVAA